MLSFDDTICAIASAPGGSARGIVRLSGPRVHEVLKACVEPDVIARQAIAVRGQVRVKPPIGWLPGDLFVWPNSRSYTRQPTAEFHSFGSPPLLAAAVQTFCEHGARGAEPGEFTLRAFLAGRLDLPQAEAVLGVIDAVGRRPLEAALAQLAGGLSRPLARLRETLLELLAHLEAGLDFAEEDIECISPHELDRALQDAEAMTVRLFLQLGSRTTATDLPRVVLAGPPNVGKSSLFNALVGRSAAIVSQHPGTTRDYLTATVEFGGVKCELVDTAGWAAVETSATVEHSAQEAATSQRERAIVTLLCQDSTVPPTIHAAEMPGHGALLYVCTKCDQARGAPSRWMGIETSSATGHGLDNLACAIAHAVAAAASEAMVVGTAERCHESLHGAKDSLRRARDLNRHCAGEELIAAELRLVLFELGKVAGAVYTDDILERIFSRFCIGK